ncbi:MAG: hypothetical protein JSW55_02115 [Chloroflexota bacterium]|nr:MAG: hypothetical protein JSW55_02115 [Chloroflexota bacterium]
MTDSNLEGLQLTLGMGAAHRNRYLCSDHYLENLLACDPCWPAGLAEAASFLAWMQALYT